MIPLVKYFWNSRNTMMIGTAARAAPAMIRPKSVIFSACSFAIPSEIVRFCVLDNSELANISRNKTSAAVATKLL